jgi:hypothetical protein
MPGAAPAACPIKGLPDDGRGEASHGRRAGRWPMNGPPNAERRPQEGSGSSASGLARRLQGTTSVRQDASRRAVEHVAAVLERCPEMVVVDQAVWVAAVVAHLEPLPADRAWRVLAVRRCPTPLHVLAPAVERRLRPPVGTRPQPVCPVWCRRTHQEAA